MIYTSKVISIQHYMVTLYTVTMVMGPNQIKTICCVFAAHSLIIHILYIPMFDYIHTIKSTESMTIFLLVFYTWPDR